MDESVELVAQKCSQQLNDFQRCTLAHRHESDGGAQSCNVQRQALSTCAADAVPLVATVKRMCQRQIRAYDACLHAGKSDNDEQITQRCTPALTALWQCTEAAKRDAGNSVGRAQAAQIDSTNRSV